MKKLLMIISICLVNIMFILGATTSDYSEISECLNNKLSKNMDYKMEMRNFVEEISQYLKGKNSDFIVIGQNTESVLNENVEQTKKYLNSIDGLGREDLFYGYEKEDLETPNNVTNIFINNIQKFKDNNKVVLGIDYCSSEEKIENSYRLNSENGYISFAADTRELNSIPYYPQKPINENSNNILKLGDIKNFLYIINDEKYNNKEEFINDLKNTNYDLIIMDCFFYGEYAYTKEEIESLKYKKNGGKRLVISYMSIGEAEDYRYYWNNTWNSRNLSFLLRENSEWDGNYIVKYWDDAWKSIIYGNDNSYCNKILTSGFDGVYLDIIDGYENFEE